MCVRAPSGYISMCASVYARMGLRFGLMYSHSCGGGRRGDSWQSKGVSVTSSECDRHTDSFVPTHLCQSRRADGRCD